MEKQQEKDVLNGVLAVDGSTVFHFRSLNHFHDRETNEPVCGLKNGNMPRLDITKMSLEEAISNGRRPCKDCTRLANKLYDHPIYSCFICNELNLVNDREYVATEKKYATKPSKIVRVCSDCIGQISKMLEDK